MIKVYFIFLLVSFPAFAFDPYEKGPPEAEIIYSDDEIIIVYDPQTDTTITYPVDHD